MEIKFTVTHDVYIDEEQIEHLAYMLENAVKKFISQEVDDAQYILPPSAHAQIFRETAKWMIESGEYKWG